MKNATNLLRRFVARHRDQRAAAEALHISQAYLSDMLHARRNITDGVLEKLGYVRDVRIVRRAKREA